MVNWIETYNYLMTVLVVWIHSARTSSNIQYFLGTVLGDFAVPAFFILSGYLFFRNFKKLSMDFFLNKWKHRMKTLLIPYLFWNFAYYVVYLMAGKAEWSFQELLNAVLKHSYNPVFWFMEELIILVLLTPLLEMLLNGKIRGLILLSGFWYLAARYEILPFHLVNEDALFYFSSGIYLSLNFRKEIEDRESSKKFSISLCLISLISAILFWLVSQYAALPKTYMFVGYRVSAALSIFLLMSLLPESWNLQGEYKKISFFIYATHYLELRLVYAILGEGNDLVFLSMPAICTFLSWAVSRIMKSRFSKFYSLISGGR